MGTRKNTDMFNTTDLNLVPYSIKKFGLFTSSLITSPDSVAIKRGLDLSHSVHFRHVRGDMP